MIISSALVRPSILAVHRRSPLDERRGCSRRSRWKLVMLLHSSPVLNMEAPASPSSSVGRVGGASAVMLTSGASGRVNALLSVWALRAAVALLQGLLLLVAVPFRRRRAWRMPVDKEKEKEATTGGLRVPAARVPRKMGSADFEVPERRAMAIRRVDKAVGLDGNGSTARNYFLFVTPQGHTLFTQSWTPASHEFRGLAILLHGLNEHSGRYDSFARKLNANGYKVYGMDWIGHGGSDGLHGYVYSLDAAVSDTKAFIEKVLTENPGYPCFVFGHSTGGAILLKTVLDPKIEALISGMVLTSPAIQVQPSHPIFTVIAPVISFLLPKFQFSAAHKQGLPVSRDPAALNAKYSDPLVFTGSIRVRTGSEILRLTSYLQQNIDRVNVPFLVLHGTSDTVTDPVASERLYREAGSSDKSIKLYEGFLHDLLFEPEREEIEKDIISWLNTK